MDIGFYKRARGIKHKKAAIPFYPRPPATAPPAVPAIQAQLAGSKAKPAAAKAPPPSVVTVEVVVGSGTYSGGVGDADVDRRAAMYISRVQERLRRERVNEDWSKCY